MNRKIAAIALGRAVEAAARLTFAEATRLLETCDSLVGEVLPEAGAEPVLWRVQPIQEITEDRVPSIELAVRAHDTNDELRVYFYVSDSFQKLDKP